MNIIATNIVRRRKELKMTQRELAEKLSISDKTVSRWETGNQIPDALTIPEIARVLDMTIDELYGNKKNEKEPEQTSDKKDEDEIEEPQDSAPERKNKEYPNLEYGKITIFKIALVLGVFGCFVASTIFACNYVLYATGWILLMGLVFAGISLYFLVCEVVFHEFYKRKELSFYYEKENVKWFGLAMMVAYVILSVWMPFLQVANQYRTLTYLGITIMLSFGLILYIASMLYRRKMKKMGYEVPMSDWVLPTLVLLIGIVIVFRYIQFASQPVFSEMQGIYGGIESLLAKGGYTEKKLRMLAMAAGTVFSLGHILNYYFLVCIWQQKEWKTKTVRRVGIGLATIIIVLLLTTFVPYGRHSVYDFYVAATNDNPAKRMEVNSATIGIKFSNHSEAYTFFKLNEDANIGELIDRMSKIRIDEGRIGDAEDGNSCFIELRGKVYDRQSGVWIPRESDQHWQITISESGQVWYAGEEKFVIKGHVDWDGLYELAMREYGGVNRELYEKWLEE